jgi:hypothetical protein
METMNVNRIRGLALSALVALALPACSGGDTSGSDAGDEPWLRASATWTSLYDVYFGPAGVGSCSTASGCHLSADQAGSISSNFTCADKDACYLSLTGSSHLVSSADASDPASAQLFLKLRQNTGTGRMPSMSTFVFQPQDIEVMKTWIGKGAKND